MILDKLDWILLKQRNTINSLQEVINKDKVVYMGSVPDDLTNYDLINIYKERFRILELLKNYNKNDVINQINNIQDKMLCKCMKCKYCFYTKNELEILKEYLGVIDGS